MRSKTKVDPKQILQIAAIYLFAFLALTACSKGFKAKATTTKDPQADEQKLDEQKTADQAQTPPTTAPKKPEFKLVITTVEKTDMSDRAKPNSTMFTFVVSDGVKEAKIHTYSEKQGELSTSDAKPVDGHIFKMQSICAEVSCEQFAAIVEVSVTGSEQKMQSAALYQDVKGEIKALKVTEDSHFNDAAQALAELSASIKGS